MAKIFIIHSKGLYQMALKLTEKLEAEGHSVYFPLRDTNQNVPIGQICESNKQAIIAADEVRIIWDGTSHGVIFDTGMAFALGKKIKTEYVNEKSIKDLLLNFRED
jgi:hypothetical protein